MIVGFSRRGALIPSPSGEGDSINAHNHLAYNVLPAWDIPEVNDRPLIDVYDWREGLGPYRPAKESYNQNVTWPKADLMDAGLAAEVGKWAEIKELVSGTTTTQGSFSFRGRRASEEEPDGFRVTFWDG